MNKKALAIIAALAVVAISAVILMRGNETEKRAAQYTPNATQPETTHSSPSSHSSSTQTPATGRVPAHFTSPPSKESLLPTLAPEQFSGPTREAYMAVREIPQTIAQLPCYCHCDVGYGHKSLHTCFEDEHGAHCAICVNEALMAYRMEKQMNLSPAQIRERIVAHYESQQ